VELYELKIYAGRCLSRNDVVKRVLNKIHVHGSTSLCISDMPSEARGISRKPYMVTILCIQSSETKMLKNEWLNNFRKDSY